MALSGDALVAFLIAVSFGAGLNVYATVATLGLLARTGLLPLPGNLDLLGEWWVIGASSALVAVEFVADKIPGFDLLWNALQTFVRVPIGALLAYAATDRLGPGWQLAAAAGGGTIALLAHGGKMAARAAVTPSPEPFSNFALSVAEDGFTVFITWFATHHPFVAAGLVLVLLAILVRLIRWIVRALKTLVASAGAAIESA
ncbi:MAG TPA: DUF4126 domain-containing protein [Vicinamibacterales bacterium]|jgi:hypothetical protein|nr:DUF4126 domain-containing protein [Vicinamibacterales bacterium]